MSIETRSSSALFKRAEQLRRWEDSDTNRESVTPKQKPQKVKFSSGCVFLAACAAGDKEEVLRLIEKGADIDTANVDGLTALHQVSSITFTTSKRMSFILERTCSGVPILNKNVTRNMASSTGIYYLNRKIVIAFFFRSYLNFV